METSSLIEVIFNGKYLNFSFLREFLESCKEARFNFPKVSVPTNYEGIVKIFKSNSYVDFVITVSQLDVFGRIIPNVFINFGFDSDRCELLFFFDLKDLNSTDYREGVDLLKDWSSEFKSKYGFDTVVCRIDNGNSNEYYFNDDGVGPLYSQLSY